MPCSNSDSMEKETKKMVPAPLIFQPFTKTAMFSLIVFGTIGGLSIAAIVILSLFIDREVEKADAAKVEFVSLSGRYDEIAELNKRYPAAKALRAELEKVVPLSIEVPTKVFPLVRALAQQYGFTIDLSLGKELPGVISGGSGFEFTVTAEGNLVNLKDFLSAVEELDTVVQITQWSLSPTGGIFRLAFGGIVFTRNE